MTAALIWAPFADRESARIIARQMVEEKLVACANILGEIESVFEWRGEVDTASEIGVLFKTTTARCEDAVKRLGQLHPI